MLKNKKVLLWMFLGFLFVAAVAIGIAIPFMISVTNSSPLTSTTTPTPTSPSTTSTLASTTSTLASTASASTTSASASTTSTTTTTTPSRSQKGKLMIVGGAIYNGANVHYNTTEIIDLDHENSICQLTTEYPHQASNIQAGVLNVSANPKVIFCGGISDDGIASLSCFEYSLDEFHSMNNLTNQAVRSASAVQMFEDFEEQFLWITGGSRQSRTQLVSYSKVLEGPEIPIPNKEIVHHCVVALKSTTVMIIGGQISSYDSSETFWYDFDSGQWMQGPELSIARERHACSVFESEDELRIYVTGGYNDVTGNLDSVEIAVLDQDNILAMNWKWIEGPRLLFRTREHAQVSTKSGVYVIGGLEGDDYCYSDSIFELNLLSEKSTWIKIPQKMKVPRSYVAALILPEESPISCQ